MTGSIQANHRSARSPGPKREGPARREPIAGPRRGTTRSKSSAPASAGASGRQNEPGSLPAFACPAQPPSRAGGASPRVVKGTTASEKPTGAPRAAAPDEARRTTRGHQARQRGTPPSTTKAHGQVPSNNGNRVAQTLAATTGRNEPRHQKRCQATPNPHTPNASQETRGTSRARTQAHTHRHTPARSGAAQPKPEPKRTHPQRTAQPGVVAYKRRAHTNTHEPQHPSQEWWGAAETQARAHTPTPHTPVKSGVAQPKPQLKRTHPHRTAQPGVVGYRRSAHTNTHELQHPSQEWRGAAETRARAHTPPAHSPARIGGV